MYLSLEKEYYEVVKTVFGVWKKRVITVGGWAYPYINSKREGK